MTPAEQTVIIQRVCGQCDWFKTVHFRQNGTPVLICSRQLSCIEHGHWGDLLTAEGIPPVEFQTVYSAGERVTPPRPPPGVTFDPLTGCLTISPESGVKRVAVPEGVVVEGSEEIAALSAHLNNALEEVKRLRAAADTGHCCKECHDNVTVCPECSVIVIGCKCGECLESWPFKEDEL